ncbi:hypothetical protein OTU49_008571 [Cherax quadricarinatus]|uniref:Apolipoprotein D n=3 Tax=Cherax quadricarinatus TaxID=27406 RepID=A0AAW0WF23_CHEQU
MVAPTATHQMMWGTCSSNSYTPMPDFNPEKFSGSWYVLKKLVTTSRCLSTTFELQNDTRTFKVKEIRTPVVADMTPYKATVTNEGILEMNPEQPAKMKLDWSGNFLDEVLNTYYTIIDTDYTSYALDLECQSWGFFKRVSATILSRSKELPAEKITELENTLSTKYKIDLTRLNTIDHSNCFSATDVDYNIKIDANGLSLLGLLSDDNLTQIHTVDAAEAYLNISENLA